MLFGAVVALVKPCLAYDEAADIALTEFNRRIPLESSLKELADKARAATAKRDWDEAIKLHEQVNWKLFGELYRFGERPEEEVRSTLGKAVYEVRPFHSAGIGFLYLLKGDIAKAKTQFQNILTLNIGVPSHVNPMGRIAALAGMKRACEMEGRYAEATHWQMDVKNLSRDGWGPCWEGRDKFLYAENQTLIAGTGRAPAEALTSIKAGGLKIRGRAPDSDRIERDHGKLFATFLLAELHYREGNKEKAKLLFEEVLTRPLTDHRVIETFTRSYLDKIAKPPPAKSGGG